MTIDFSKVKVGQRFKIVSSNWGKCTTATIYLKLKPFTRSYVPYQVALLGANGHAEYYRGPWDDGWWECEIIDHEGG